MNDIIEIVYGDVKREWNNGNYFQAIAQGYFAPYTALVNVIGDFLKTDSSLTDDDGVNIERIILFLPNQLITLSTKPQKFPKNSLSANA